MHPSRIRLIALLSVVALVVALAAINRGGAASRSGPTTNLSNGITFDHATLNDPVRMVGEPDIYSDFNGGLYVSGPGGSTTQASWFWKSDDHGIQWHSIGVVPEGKSNGQNGGGDTEITIGDNNDVFASDLQTLQCNSVFRSYDQGKTFLTSEGCFPETDRQWMGIYDPSPDPNNTTGRRVYLSANGQVQGCYFLVSTDNGVSYGPPDPVNNPSAAIHFDPLDPLTTVGCIGRFAVNPTNGHIFVPTDSGTWVSTNGGVSFTHRADNGAEGNFFANIAVDSAGNLWQGWTTACSNPPVTPCKAYISYSTDEAVTWHAPIQVNTGLGSPVGTSPDLRQMLFPWTVAGDPGRVAVVYYATTDTQRAGGYPGGPNAAWHAYAAISTNAMDPNPTFTQVQADEHVMHRGTVCTGGFPGCLINNSDRSMADFFAVERDPDGRLFIAYNENSDLSLVVPAPAEYIGKPINAVIRLRTGPSLFAAKGLLGPIGSTNVAISSAVVNAGTLTVTGTQGLPPGNWTKDPAGDGKFPVVPTESANHPALDIVEASVGESGSNLVFKIKVSDLSAAAIAEAASAGGQPSWMMTWWQGKGGIGPSGLTPPYHSHWFVKCLGTGTTCALGKVSSIDAPALGAPTPKLMTYVPSTNLTGTVNGNEITVTAPISSFSGNGQSLASGDKLDHITAYALAEHSGDVTLPSVVDQAKSFSYIIGTAAAGQHLPDGYVQVSLDPSFNTTLATLSPTANTWTASIPGAPSSGTVYARQVLSKDLYTPLWDDVQAGPSAQRAYGGSTAVSVRSFSAARAGRTVVLSWRTGSEARLLGFHLYREQAGHRARLNARLIAARAGVGSHTYTWRDHLKRDVSVRYTLEEVRSDGSRVEHGLASASKR